LERGPLLSLPHFALFLFSILEFLFFTFFPLGEIGHFTLRWGCVRLPLEFLFRREWKPPGFGSPLKSAVPLHRQNFFSLDTSSPPLRQSSFTAASPSMRALGLPCRLPGLPTLKLPIFSLRTRVSEKSPFFIRNDKGKFTGSS